MFQVEFYENSKAESEIFDYIEKLRTQADNNKDSRIQYRQMVFYIELLKKGNSFTGKSNEAFR